MHFTKWETRDAIRQVTCVHTDAEKFKVTDCLTVGKTYDVKNETEEFIFIQDDTGKIGGFLKTYFK